MAPPSASENYRKALHLEKQMNAETETSGKNRFRGPLCEILADLILEHTQFSVDKDLVWKLWRLCFYERIQPLRIRISKEKRKQLDSKKTQETLNYLLNEGHKFYDFLVKTLYENIDQPGVVLTIHRLHISIGDLYRYGDKINKAEEAYKISAALAPGHGHPFNQIAVIHQMKETNGTPMSAIALYWYARALLAPTDPFHTAVSNLHRLFTANREWLEEQDYENTIQDSKTQNQLFLAQFCELQCLFFTAKDSLTLLPKVKESANDFQTLIDKSTMGDTLLCRIVTIMAFSECYRDTASLPKDMEERQPILANTSTLGRTMIYQFGCALAKRIMTLLQKAPSRGLPPSVRVLMPYLLLTEYCIHRKPPLVNVDEVTLSAYHSAKEEFWKLFIEIWNKLTALVPPHELKNSDETENLKEYRNLAGFAPFSDFCKVGSDGLASASEAATILQERYEALEAATTQDIQDDFTRASMDSALMSTASSQNPAEGILKVSRLIELGRLLLKHEELGEQIRIGAGGMMEWISAESTEDDDDDAVMLDEPSVNEMETENETGETVLVYKQSTSGASLLVPDSLERSEVPLSAKTNSTNVSKATSVDHSMATEKVSNVQASSNSVQAPVGLAASFSSPLTSPEQRSLLNPTPSGTRPPPGFAPPPPGFSTIGDMLPAPPPTSNPFAEPWQAPQYNAVGATDPTVATEEASLLDSSLLRSLFGSTENPFYER